MTSKKGRINQSVHTGVVIIAMWKSGLSGICPFFRHELMFENWADISLEIDSF